MQGEDPTKPITPEGQRWEGKARGRGRTEGPLWAPVWSLDGLQEEVTLQSAVKATSPACTRLRALPAASAPGT